MTPAMHTYTTLLQGALHTTITPNPHDVAGAARAVLTLAHEQGPLELLGAWRVHPREARALELLHGSVPPGGWHHFVGLMAGTPWLSLDTGGFTAIVPPEALSSQTHEDIQRTLLEAFTRQLVPPTTAAGLFLHMGLQPGWGLRLATSMHGTRRPAAQERDGVEACALGVFGAISIILQALRSLDPTCSYDVERFAALVHESCLYGRCVIENTRPHRRMFLDDLIGPIPDMASRALEFTVVDLFEGYLMPAGVITRCDDERFQVHAGAIPEDLEIAGEGALSASEGLMCLLQDEAPLVA